MATYNVHAGHNAIIQGANSQFGKEHVLARQVKDAVIAKMRALGHTVYDCTDEVGTTKGGIVSNVVKKCNAHKVDLDISLHLNAYNGSASGVEVCYYDAKALADKVSAQLSKDIGWKDRGGKERKDLYVLANTKATAILIEMGFIDNAGDMAKWGVDKVANSIVYAITGQRVEAPKPAPQPAPPQTAQKEFYRVLVDGVNIGSYTEVANALEEAEKAMKAHKGKIELVRVLA